MRRKAGRGARQLVVLAACLLAGAWGGAGPAGWAAAAGRPPELPLRARGVAAERVALAAPPAEAPAAADWNQWRGPNRDGVSTETGWRTDWSARPPRTAWKRSVGAGFSSMAVVAGRVYTMGNSGDVDTVWCLRAEDGEPAWRHSYECPAVSSYPGPRATPTVADGRVYTLSRMGHLFCLDARDGKVLWAKHVVQDLGGNVPKWGLACSPLVLGDRLVLDVGPALALDKASGRLLWRSGSDAAGYSSPVAFSAGRGTLIACFNAFGPRVLDAATGRELGRLRWETQYGVNAATPVASGGRLFISSGYGAGCALVAVGPGGLRPLVQSKDMRNHANTCVLYGGHLYGFDGQVGGGGELKCLDLATAAVRWRQGGLGTGSLMVADGKLVILSERGDLALAEASPAGYRELGRAKVLGGTCWTMPVLAGGRIFCRNAAGDLVCVDVAAGGG